MKKGNFEPGFKRDSTVLIPIIKQYLAAHKRLVVPQLGAFIVKEPERSVVFRLKQLSNDNKPNL